MKLDAPLYTEAELDALERDNPREALRIAREQEILKRQLSAEVPAGSRIPTTDEIKTTLEEARKILLRDGGDLEFVALEGDVVVVRLKGACAGCPRAALDLKGVVEALLRRRHPAIREVRNLY
ncbi:MAG TPA: NifU family protein [Burkholderiales bacterium]|nr:NifU family protein [Burkholderiales bacterium]